MLVVDVVRRISREVPEARLAGFVALLNDQVERLWEAYRWPFYVAETSLTATHTFSNLSITNGVTTATVVDDDANSLFDALHTGRRFTIEGTGYTVQSVTDANTLVLTGLYDFDGGSNPESGTLPRVVLALPAAFGRVYGRPRPTNTANYDLGDPDLGLMDPEDYVLCGPVAGIYTLELRVQLAETHTVRYVRRPTATTGPGSTVDIDSPLEKVLYQGLLATLLQGVDARNEIHLAQLQQRIRRAEGLYALGLKEAKQIAGTLSERTGRNRSWGF